MSANDIENVWINGCEEWIRTHQADGWTAYYVNFMFEPLYGTVRGIIDQMHRAMHKQFYVPFHYKFVRNSHRQREQERMPRLMLFPDRPVMKREKSSLREVTINSGGLHFNGPLLIPPVSRFRECPIEHIQENQGRYTRGRIARVHVKPIDDRIHGIADYSAKTIKWHRADPDDVLMLPKSLSEVKPTTPALTPDQKAIKDIVSAHNVSEEYARWMYEDARRAG